MCGLIDRSGYVFDDNGIAPDRLRELCEVKAKGGKPKGTDLGAWSKATGLDVNLKSRPPATSGRNSNPS